MTLRPWRTKFEAGPTLRPSLASRSPTMMTATALPGLSAFNSMRLNGGSVSFSAEAAWDG